MGVTTENGISTKTGAGFYAIFNPQNEFKDIRSIGYSKGGKVKSKFFILEPNPLLVGAFNSEFGAFLTTVYKAGLNVAGEETRFDLTALLLQNGLINYNSLQTGTPEDWVDPFKEIFALDFLVLCGIIQYDISPHLGPSGTPRPAVSSFELGDKQNMFDVIKFMGLSGFLHYLFIAKAMTWEEYRDCIFYFFPDSTERRNYITRLNYVLRFYNLLIGPGQMKELKLDE